MVWGRSGFPAVPFRLSPQILPTKSKKKARIRAETGLAATLMAQSTTMLVGGLQSLTCSAPLNHAAEPRYVLPETKPTCVAA